MAFLKIVTNKFVNLVLTVIIASIPFYIFIASDIKYGTGNYYLRYDEAFMTLAMTMGIVTLLVELGKLFHSKTISGIFNYVSFAWAAFHALYLVVYTHDPFYFFQAMCSWGIMLYPVFYILIRKFVYNGLFIPFVPIVDFGLCMLFGLIPAYIGNEFVAFKLPFIVIVVGLLAVAYFIFRLGWDIISTSYMNTMGRLFDGYTPSGKGDTGDKETKRYETTEDKINREIKRISNGYFDITDTNIYQNMGYQCATVKIRRVGSYPDSFYQHEKDALEAEIESAIRSAGYPAGRVKFIEVE